MNFALLKITAKKNVFLTGIFLLVMLMYSVVMISMFSPDSIDALNAMFKVMPPDVMKAFGFSGVFTNFTGYIASWLYGLILTAFPLVYCIILSNKLVAKTVDNCSIACLLSTPISRSKIIITKSVYAILSLVIMHAVIFGFNLLVANAMFPAESIDIPVFIKLNITVMLVNLTALSITFFFSCLFNNSRLSMGFGSGVTIAFLLFNMLGNASDDAKILKNISIYGWYNPVGIANGEATLSLNLIYIGIIFILFAAGTAIFKRKRMPI